MHSAPIRCRFLNSSSPHWLLTFDFVCADQYYYSGFQEMRFTPSYPIVVKVAHVHAGYGRLLFCSLTAWLTFCFAWFFRRCFFGV